MYEHEYLRPYKVYRYNCKFSNLSPYVYTCFHVHLNLVYLFFFLLIFFPSSHPQPSSLFSSIPTSQPMVFASDPLKSLTLLKILADQVQVIREILNRPFVHKTHFSFSFCRLWNTQPGSRESALCLNGMGTGMATCPLDTFMSVAKLSA